MRRSICYSEPQMTRAGTIQTHRFYYTASATLPEGSLLKFDIVSSGKPSDWQTPSVDLKQQANVIFAQLEDGEILTAQEVFPPNQTVPQYEFSLKKSLKVNSKITFVIGASPFVDPELADSCGNRCQLISQRRRPFFLYIDTKGKSNYEEPEIFTIDVKGNTLATMRVLSPSFVVKNKRFDISVRFEDQFGNLTNYAPEGTLIDLSYKHLRENLNWKLFVPETGLVTLPNLYCNEEGIYRIKLKNIQTGEIYLSAPMKCFTENNTQMFWGLLHGDSPRFDIKTNIDNYIRYFHEELALNFFATSSFENQEETSNELWKNLYQYIADLNEDSRFVTMCGFQYKGESSKEGLRQILYHKTNKPILRKKEAKYSSLSKIYKAFSPKDLMSIPMMTMNEDCPFDFKETNPSFENIIEIYNAWGSSESENTARPIKGQKTRNSAGSIVSALKQNLRFGFVAGGFDSQTFYQKYIKQNLTPYSPGLTAILSENCSREDLMEALTKKSCYATTGARIIVGFHVAGSPMGSELSTISKPGLRMNRHLSGYVAGTTTIEKIEVIRNGDVIFTHQPDDYHCDYTFDDNEPLETVVLVSKDGSSFVFYYLRVTQADGHIAWSSPIWVDLEPLFTKKAKS